MGEGSCCALIRAPATDGFEAEGSRVGATDDSMVHASFRRLSMHRCPRDRKAILCKHRRRTRPRPEVLEDRLAPAVQRTYGGAGSILGVQELVAGATPVITISEPKDNTLLIDLGSSTFDGSSTSAASGLAYENAGTPATSHTVTVDI